jgi:hypothetical protein
MKIKHALFPLDEVTRADKKPPEIRVVLANKSNVFDNQHEQEDQRKKYDEEHKTNKVKIGLQIDDQISQKESWYK